MGSEDFENQSMKSSFCLYLGCFRIMFLMIVSRKTPQSKLKRLVGSYLQSGESGLSVSWVVSAQSSQKSVSDPECLAEA